MKKNIFYLLLLFSSVAPYNYVYSMDENNEQQDNQNQEQNAPAIHPEIRRIAEAFGDLNNSERMANAARIYEAERNANLADAMTRNQESKIEANGSKTRANDASAATQAALKLVYDAQKANEEQKSGWKGLGWKAGDQFVGGVGSGLGQLSVEAIKYLVIKVVNQTPLDEVIQEATQIINQATSKLQGVSTLRKNDPHRKLTEFLAGQELVWASLQVSNAIYTNRLSFMDKVIPFKNKDYKNLINAVSQLHKNSQEYGKLAFERTHDAKAIETTTEYLKNRMAEDMKSFDAAIGNVENVKDKKTLTSYINKAAELESVYSEGAKAVYGPYKQEYRDFANKCAAKKTEMMQQYNEEYNKNNK